MRRLVYSVLVLMMFLFGSSTTLFATPIIQGVTLTQNDGDGDGILTVDDSFQISVVATFTNPAGELWELIPYVDLSEIGGPAQQMLTYDGNTTYNGSFNIEFWRASTPNYETIDLDFSARSSGMTVTTTVTTFLMDIVQVDGADPSVISSNATDPAIVNQLDVMTFTIDDNLYQSTPNGDTEATVDLTPIGGANNAVIPYVGGILPVGEFLVTGITPNTNIEYTGAFTISLKDPFNPAQTYPTNIISVDTISPTVDAGNTNIQVMSGNNPALAGDVLRLTAAVTAYDGETVTVQCASLTALLASPDISSPYAMTLNNSSGIGNAANWITDVVLSPEDLKNGNLPVTFVFTDNAGNSTTVARNIAIDLEIPAFTTLTAEILYPDTSPSPYDVGTTTCQIKLVASIPINAGPDTLTVTADLASIGGNAVTPMAQVVSSGNYECRYIIPAGTLEDVATFAFAVTAQDVAGNVVAQATTPDIAIDNNILVASNMVFTTPGPVVKEGDIFFIGMDVVGIENGSVSVDLSAIGLLATEDLPLISGNTYGRAFAFGNGNVDGTFSFNISANDTCINPDGGAELIAHIVQMTTPAHKFYNRTVSVNTVISYADGSISPHTVATLSCNIGVIASIPASLTTAPLSVVVDMSSIDGDSAMALTKNAITGNYVGTYTLATGTIEDFVTGSPNVHNFLVTASDVGGDVIIASTTTPAIAVDSFPPVVTGYIDINTTPDDGYIIAGEDFSISLNVTGIEVGTVSVDLSPIGLATNVIILPDPLEPTNYFASFTLQVASSPAFVHRGLTKFDVTITDTVRNPIGLATMEGNLVSRQTGEYWFDNNPITIISTHKTTSHKWASPYDNGAIRIGDALSFYVQLGNVYGTPPSVEIDLSAMGLGATLPMTATSPVALGVLWYEYSLPDDVATGTLLSGVNCATISAIINVTDEYLSTISTSTPVYLDNVPIEVGADAVNITLVDKPNHLGTDTSIINFNKSLDISIPFTAPDAAAATATIDLEYIGLATDTDLDLSSPNYISTIPIDTASTSALAFDDPSYRFQAYIYDEAGNRTIAQSVAKSVDCFPPSITTATVTIVSGSSLATATIGSGLRFNAILTDNEGTNPTIDLSSLGGSANQIMSPVVGGYEYMHTVATGVIDATLASWTITAWDNALNYATSSTNEIRLDNVPPMGNSIVVVGAASPINIGNSVTFTINPASGVATATIDLTSMGWLSNELMAAPGFSTTLVGKQANASYPGHVFTAILTDANGNTIVSTSSPYNVDCQAPSFSNHGIFISEYNGDNLSTATANLNDVITVYASASASIDATVLATIALEGGVDFATATMTLNTTLNRHEATFTVSPTPVNNWVDSVNSKLTYKITASDIALNIATQSAGVSSFTVINVAPTISIATFTLETNIDALYYGLLPVYNIASSSPNDELTASVQLANAHPIHDAWIDFSDARIANIMMDVLGNGATTSVGISAIDLPSFDYVQKELTIVVRGEGGQSVSTNTSIIIDNVAPTITSSTFTGATLTVNISEEISLIDETQWQIVGSNTSGLPAYLQLTQIPNIITPGSEAFEVSLTLPEQKQIAQWASTSLYLQVANIPSPSIAPLTDRAENWMKPIGFSPITITDSAWREEPRVAQVIMTKNWPASITIDIMFNKNMESDTFIASSGVLLTYNLSYDNFNSPDYRTGYILQAQDSYTWISPTHLQISMCKDGMDWIAAKLTNNPSARLKFATRSSTKIFVDDYLGKPMVGIPTSLPIDATIVTAVTHDIELSMDDDPILNLASKTLILNMTDRFRLFSNDFRSTGGASNPSMASPSLNVDNAVTTFHSRISLYDEVSGSNKIDLVLEPLSIPSNNNISTDTIILKLTDTDVANIFALMAGNSSPEWGLQTQDGIFHNWWGTPNIAYLPSGFPGHVEMILPTSADAPATLAACSMSDKPPFNEHDIIPADFFFEIEVNLPKAGLIEVPIQVASEPIAQIMTQETTPLLLASATFVSWTSRVVDGTNRAVARFSISRIPSSTLDLDNVPAQIEIFGIADIFGGVYDFTASYAYDLNTKDLSIPIVAGGFTDPVSAPIVIDTHAPTVVSVTPGGIVNLLPSVSPFGVTFDEPMDRGTNPTLTLTNPPHTLYFTFTGWSADSRTASFTNNTAFTSSTPNGTWTYQVTAYDAASNMVIPTTAEVQIRTQVPVIVSGGVSLKTIQNIVDSSVTLINQPWSAHNPNLTANFSIEYAIAPAWSPHSLQLYDGNTLVGSAPITTIGNLGESAFTYADFIAPRPGSGTYQYDVKIVDSVSNETNTLTTITYDDSAPVISTYNFGANIGSSTANTVYYNKVDGDFRLNIVATSTIEELRLAIDSYAVGVATITQDFEQDTIVTTNHSLEFGSSLSNGSYTLTIIDAAGNVASATGFPITTLIVDDDRPTVVSIDPIYPATDIGNAPSRGATFTVVFSEPMDGSSGLEPTLSLTMATSTIDMVFVEWNDPTTANYNNITEIATSIPSGIYDYSASGGRDLAHNALTEPIAGSFQVQVYSKGPVAKITNTTLQSHLYGATPPVDLGFIPAFNPTYGPATLHVDYSSGRYNTLHSLLIYDELGAKVGSYGNLLDLDEQDIMFTGADGLGWEIDPAILPPGTYSFRIQDASGNMISGYHSDLLVIDTASPTVTAINISDGLGIASDSIFYYSSDQGTATFEIASDDANDNLRLVVISDATGTITTASTKKVVADHIATYGYGLEDGDYWVTATDLAGNMALVAPGGASFAVRMVVDNTKPTIASILPLISGGYPAGAGEFDVTFNEPMNTSATPTLIIATNSASIPDISMTCLDWIDPQTCRFTNTNAIDASLSAGEYSYQVTNGQDLAGNKNVDPASDTFTVELFTQAPKFAAVLLSEQTELYGASVLTNQPYSSVATGVASLSITYSEGPYQLPHTLLLYGDGNVQVATITNVVPSGAVATITVNAGFFGTATSPVVCSFKLVDSIGNESAISTTKIVYDISPHDIGTATVATVSTASSTPMYYNPALHGPLNVTLLTDASDTLKLTIATTTAIKIYPMTSNFWNKTIKTVTIPKTVTSTYGDGEYIMNAYDSAGNIGVGSDSNLKIIFDTIPASVTLPIALLGGEPLNNVGARLATFTVTFSEPMNQFKPASTILTLATTTHSIAFEVASWPSTNVAEFVNVNAISSTIPQGDYTANITCYDITGNYASISNLATVSVITRGPEISAVLLSKQTELYGASVLTNQPYSSVATSVASLSIIYSEGPYEQPHSLFIRNASGTLVNTISYVPTGMAATITVDAGFFGPIPTASEPIAYSFRLGDNIGNLSATSSTKITYDIWAPDITTSSAPKVSNATDTAWYYNPQLHGDLLIDLETDTTDALILTIATGATVNTYPMTSTSSGNYAVSVSQAIASATLSEGEYVVNAFDLAGNEGYGDGSNQRLILDFTPPQVALTGAGVASVTVTSGEPITTAEIGQASITVEFNEPMAQTAEWAPGLTLATSTHSIHFGLATWTSPTTAIFNNKTVIEPGIPQGDYICDIFCFDITGNKSELASVTTIDVQSDGPDVMSIITTSHQYTTASDSSELKIDMPFSLALNPGGATMSIRLNSIPDATPTHILFTQNDVTIGSYPIVFDASNIATFTWVLGRPASALNASITYVVKFTDASGDYSLQSYKWTMDSVAPVVTSQPTITGGEIASEAVYYNPLRHGNLTAHFEANEVKTPVLRVQGINSTDTYQMVSAGTNLWSGAFNGRYSRGGNPKSVVPNGTYTMSLVDLAGNVGVAAVGSSTVPVATFVVDTGYPRISTYSISVAGTAVTKYAPAAGLLNVSVVSPETRSKLGIYWLNVFNSAGVVIKKVPLSDSGMLDHYVANWDGTNNSGTTITGGRYKLHASDYAGNLATGSLWIDTFTSPFKVISANQLSTSTVKIWFNQKLDASSIAGNAVEASGGLTVSNITLAEPQSLTMTIDSMTHATNYRFTVATGSVKNLYGVGISGPANSAAFVADAAGPVVTSVSFVGASGARQFRVNFDEIFDATMASDVANYNLVGPSGAITIATVVPQSGHKSVLITASADLIDKQSYTVTVSGLEDRFGNMTVSTESFTGRDLTPPSFEIGVFSNPTNENDIIVVVTVSEQLQNTPKLLIAQNGTRPVSALLQQGSATNTYMIGAHLSPSHPGNGTIEASGLDESGNSGSESVYFAVAVVASKRASNMFSADKHTMLSFNESSLNEDAMVKIFSHKLISDRAGKGSVKTSMRSICANILGNVRASEITTSEIVKVGQSELIPTGKAYEVGISASKIAGTFKLMMATNATSSVGIGLFRQDVDSWTFVSKTKTSKNNYYASVKQAGMYAILQDVKAPVISFAPELNTAEPFKTDRPEFTGTIIETGSGLDNSSVKAYVDNGPAQSVIVNADGSFVFKTMAQLTGGMHTLIIKASDNTGNPSVSPEIRFEVVVPLTITQIVQYPNPARRKMFVRISANRADITEDLVRVRIYDTAGHKVTTLDGIKPVRETWGLNARYLYDVPWDLRNQDGRTVANGVYFAKVEIRDPDNPSKKTKRIQKLAVLR